MIKIHQHLTRRKRVLGVDLLPMVIFLSLGVGGLLEFTAQDLVEARTSAFDSALTHDQELADQDAPFDSSRRTATREDSLAGQPNAPKELVTAPDVLSGLPDSVVALYFHRTLRCEDCLLMEDYIRDVLRDDYLDPLLNGSLCWRSLDYERPEHVDSADKYQFGGPALVLSHWVGGREVLWARMDEIWEWVDDPEAVADTLRAQLRECLAGTCAHAEFYEPDAGDIRAPGETTKGSEERMRPDNEQR